MPRMSGKELAQKLTGLCPSVKVIYVSGYPANVISYHGILEAGLNFLQKPFGSIELLAKVRKIIDGESPRGRASELSFSLQGRRVFFSTESQS